MRTKAAILNAHPAKYGINMNFFHSFYSNIKILVENICFLLLNKSLKQLVIFLNSFLFFSNKISTLYFILVLKYPHPLYC